MPKTQLSAGRPKTAVDKSNLPETPTMTPIGELPKKIIGSHMGFMTTGSDQAPKAAGPAIPAKPKLPPRPKKAPPM